MMNDDPRHLKLCPKCGGQIDSDCTCLSSHEGVSGAKSEGFASTGGSAPSLAAKLQETPVAASHPHSEAPVVNLVCSAPVERSAAPKWRRFHMRLCVRGAIRNKMFKGFRHDDGRPMTKDEALDALLDALKAGKEYLPIGECDNWSDEKGCLGHPIEAADSGPGVGQKATSSVDGGANERATARNS